MDEVALIQGCRDLDRNAQREFYERHVDRVYRLALRLMRNEQDAFDVAQEAFIQAFANIGSFDSRSSLSTWLYRIVTNEALQLLRRKGIERRHLSVIRSRPTETTSNESQRLELEEAIQRLSDDHRVILVLKYQQGLSYEQLGEALGIGPGTIASRLSRARNELRRILSGNSEAHAEETDPVPHPTNVADTTGRCSDGV